MGDQKKASFSAETTEESSLQENADQNEKKKPQEKDLEGRGDLAKSGEQPDQQERLLQRAEDKIPDGPSKLPEQPSQALETGQSQSTAQLNQPPPKPLEPDPKGKPKVAPKVSKGAKKGQEPQGQEKQPEKQPEQQKEAEKPKEPEKPKEQKPEKNIQGNDKNLNIQGNKLPENKAKAQGKGKGRSIADDKKPGAKPPKPKPPKPAKASKGIVATVVAAAVEIIWPPAEPEKKRESEEAGIQVAISPLDRMINKAVDLVITGIEAIKALMDSNPKLAESVAEAAKGFSGISTQVVSYKQSTKPDYEGPAQTANPEFEKTKKASNTGASV